MAVHKLKYLPQIFRTPQTKKLYKGEAKGDVLPGEQKGGYSTKHIRLPENTICIPLQKSWMGKYIAVHSI